MALHQPVDAEPREVYIIGCLLVPIIGIGLPTADDRQLQPIDRSPGGT